MLTKPSHPEVAKYAPKGSKAPFLMLPSCPGLNVEIRNLFGMEINLKRISSRHLLKIVDFLSFTVVKLSTRVFRDTKNKFANPDYSLNY